MLFFKSSLNEDDIKIVKREVIDITEIFVLLKEIKDRVKNLIKQDHIYLDDERFFIESTKVDISNTIIYLENIDKNIEIHLYVSKLGYYSTIVYKKEKKLYHIIFTTISNVLIMRCQTKKDCNKLPETVHFLFPNWFKKDLLGYIFSNTF